MKTLKNNKGFTLIELIIVIIIIGILAAVALPKYLEIKEEASDATAKGILGALRGANSVLFADYSLKTTGFVDGKTYNATTILEHANVQGAGTPVVDGTLIKFTVGGAAAAYTVSVAGPTINADGKVEPAVIKCSYARGASVDCTNW